VADFNEVRNLVYVATGKPISATTMNMLLVKIACNIA